MVQFEIVTAAKTTLGENPLWDPDDERLYWLDIFEGIIFSSRGDGREVRVQRMPDAITSFALCQGGRAIVTLLSGLHLLDLKTGELERIGSFGENPAVRPNDSKVDRQGRFVVGTVDNRLVDPSTSWLWDRIEPDAGLLSVNSDLQVMPLDGGYAISNGPCFSPDGSILYCADSWRDRIYAYDYDTGTGSASNRRVLVEFGSDKGSTGQGQPDGATVDSEGFIWSVCVYGGELRRYAPDGSLDRRLALPVLKATSAAFGGSNLDVLYLTTMANPDLPVKLPAEGPLAGSLIAVRGLGVTGIAETKFAG